MNRTPPKRFIYFAEHKSLPQIKIGISKYPILRARALGCSILGLIELGVTYTYRREVEIHRLFRRFRIKSEWYKDVPEIREFARRKELHEVFATRRQRGETA